MSPPGDTVTTMSALTARFQAAQPYTWEDVEAFADRLQSALGEAATVAGAHSRGEVTVTAYGGHLDEADLRHVFNTARYAAPPLTLCDLWFANHGQVEAGDPPAPYLPAGSIPAEL